MGFHREGAGWCQYGSPPELPNISNRAAYHQALQALPDWRIGCIFTGSRHRGAYLHTGPETLLEEFGFVRDRRIAKWRWGMRLDLTG
jgi:hypothetical protein